MYFVVLSLQKMTKKRYILDQKFILFRDPLFYRFFIDFGCPGLPENGAFFILGAFSKKMCLKKGSTWSKRGSQGAVL